MHTVRGTKLITNQYPRNKGFATWQEGKVSFKIRAEVYLTVPPEPYKPLLNLYFQILSYT